MHAATQTEQKTVKARPSSSQISDRVRSVTRVRTQLIRTRAAAAAKQLRKSADSAHDVSGAELRTRENQENGSLFQGRMLLPGENVRLLLQDQQGLRA